MPPVIRSRQTIVAKLVSHSLVAAQAFESVVVGMFKVYFNTVNLKQIYFFLAQGGVFTELFNSIRKT